MMKVIYIGDIENGYDSATRDLMRKNLITGNTYESTGVIDYSGFGDMSYIIGGLYYPVESFVIGNMRSVMAEKYNLK